MFKFFISQSASVNSDLNTASVIVQGLYVPGYRPHQKFKYSICYCSSLKTKVSIASLLDLNTASVIVQVQAVARDCLAVANLNTASVIVQAGSAGTD